MLLRMFLLVAVLVVFGGHGDLLGSVQAIGKLT